ncbi:MAG: DUF3419 family protein [Planctomycetales bacterium]
MTVRQRFSNACFQLIHGGNLVYNACWEDPRLDREALAIGADDRLLTITSAGCNALDYVLDEPRQIHAVDVNRRQNALLELKLAGIRGLDFDTFFEMFGRGRLTNCQEVYHDALRGRLPQSAREYWDRHISFFGGKTRGGSFYFRGTAGFVARSVNRYLDHVARVRGAVNAILDADSLEEQRHIYESRLRGAVWTRFIRWMMGRDTTLSLLGIPRPQRTQVERNYPGGIVRFIEDAVQAVFAELPLHDNYFWRVYLTGSYTRDCCPEYLKRGNFERLKRGLVDRISTHTCSVGEFLNANETPITRFVLLDHMDWLSTLQQTALAAEWQAIVDRAAPNARILWRSGGMHTDFVDRVLVLVGQRVWRVGELLAYDHSLASRLHPLDRVHTYGSFWIARFSAA